MMSMDAILAILARFLHVYSAIVAIGGVFYALLSVEGYSVRFRGWTLAAMLGLIGSGLYNLLTKASYPPGYHMWFGIKMLLVLHILVVLFMLSRSNVNLNKQSRWMTGIVLSSLGVVLISAYLRYLTQQGL